MKRKIAFVTGGYSGEAEISYKSALTIERFLNPEKWEVYKIDVRKDGWYFSDDDSKEQPVDLNDFSISVRGQKTRFDAVFIGIHGSPGEDGKLQGYLDLMGLPYTSCDAATSSLTFNKKYTTAVAASAGVLVARSMQLFKGDENSTEQILGELKLPVFVKPNNGGSSIGMSKVMHADELASSIAKAFNEDEQVLVEEFVQGREFTIGVLKKEGKIIPLPITEIITKKDFFDYEAKYLGASTEVTPAQINESLTGKISALAEKCYGIFNCRGIVRMDFILEAGTQEPYLLEINTVPGQSEASIVPQQVQVYGWSMMEFYDILIEECLAANL